METVTQLRGGFLFFRRLIFYMEVKIPKEIWDYQESVFFGLSFRQFFCSVMAVGTAVGLYFWLNPLLGTEMTGWMCIFGAAPFAACGFSATTG